MKITKKKHGQCLVIKVDGDLDANATSEFSDTLFDAVNAGNLHLIADLSGCEFVCSTSLGALAATLMVCRARGGELRIFSPTPNVKRLLEMTALDDILEILTELPALE